MRIIKHAVANTFLGQLNSIIGLLINVTLIRSLGAEESVLSEYVLLTSLSGIYSSIANAFLLNGSGSSYNKLKKLRLIILPYMLSAIAYFTFSTKGKVDSYLLCFLILLLMIAIQELNYINSILIKNSKWYKANVNYLLPSIINFSAIIVSPNIYGLIIGTGGALVVITAILVNNYKKVKEENFTDEKKVLWVAIIRSCEIFLVYYLELVIINFLLPEELPKYGLFIRIIFGLATLNSYGLISVSSKINHNWVQKNVFKLFILSIVVNFIVALLAVFFGFWLGLINKNLQFIAQSENLFLCSLYGSIIGVRAIIIKYFESKSSLHIYILAIFLLAIIMHISSLKFSIIVIMLMGVLYHAMKISEFIKLRK
jgi:hypothetical protein